MDFRVTGGQVNDCTQAIDLLGERKAEWVLADKGYDSQAILDHIEAMGAVAVVPSKSNRKQQRTHDKELYRKRNRIERCFSRLKHFRRCATRYEKLKQNFKSPRRSRMRLATTPAIWRYCLGDNSVRNCSKDQRLAFDDAAMSAAMQLPIPTLYPEPTKPHGAPRLSR